MIEAPEYVTPTQRKLHNEHRLIHQRFFPSPPIFAKPQEITAPPVIVEVEPVKPIPPSGAEIERDWLLIASPAEPVTIANISRLVAAKWNVTINDLRSERRQSTIVIPRQIACLLARILTLKSYPSIGNFMGGRDHTTVIASVRKFNWLGERLLRELDPSAPLEAWVNRAFELLRQRACECVEPKE